MKAIILARVSTEEQMVEGQSIPAQLAKARQYASRKGFEIKSEHQFDESSIKDKRQKFELVIDEIKHSTEQIALIVETVDRLQRSFKESVLLDEFRKQGKLELHFIRENLVIRKGSNSSEIQRWDLAVFMAKSYVLQISDNVRRTIDHKLRNGEYPSKAPYGYMNITNEDGKKWIAPDPFASKIVTQIYEWYGSESFSMEEIRAKLKEEFTLEFGKGKIDFVLKNPFYYGEMLVDGKLYPHKYQSIVSRQLWEKAQSIKAGFHKKPFKFAGLPYLYRGLLRCKHDGHSFTPEKKRKKNGREYVYYHCTEYSGKHKTAWIREEDITKQFREIISRIQIPEHIAEEISTTLRESHEGKKQYYEDVYEGLQAEHKRYESRLEKMYEHLLDGKLSEDEYDKKRNEYRAKQEEIQNKIKSLQSADDNYYITAKYILKLSQRAADLFDSSEPVVKRQIIKLLLQNCEVGDVSLCPTYRSPFHVFAEGAIRQEWLPSQGSNLGPSD